MKPFSIILLVCFFSVSSVFAQKIEWAYDVKQVSSQYSLQRHSGVEVLGVPNVAPFGMSSIYAWRVQPNAIDNEGIETAFIEVGFKNTITAKQVAVYESFHPGAVAEIFIQTFDGWKSVYTNQAVIERTAYHEFEETPNGVMKEKAGTTKSHFSLFKPDTLFQSKTKYNVLTVFFAPEKVLAVRVVLNLFAIDDWNEIDAIAVTDSDKPLEYPRVTEIREPMFADPQKNHLSMAVNSEFSEIKPVISPDERTMFFTRTNHFGNSHKNTQDIWYSDLVNTQQESCETNCEQKYENQWQEAVNYGKPFNNLIPNSVLGFTSNGKYMFLSNLYKPVDDKCDCDTVLKQSTNGISFSTLDTLNWETAGSAVEKKIEKLINTEIETIFIKPDGKIVLIVSRDSAEQKAGKPFVLVAYNEGDSVWSEPNLLGDAQKQMFIAPPSYIPQNQKELLLLIEGTEVKACKSIGWSVPQELVIDEFRNESNYLDIEIAPNDTVMFLSVEADNSLGKRDIYISFRKKDNTWKKPVNIGETINTISDDDSPFLDDDGLMFYFASAGHHGYGDRDVYVCRRLDDTYTKWSKPLNLGKRVNTINSDAFFSIAPNSRMAHFSSTDNTIGCNGKSDIYSIRMLRPINLMITGKVYDYTNFPRVLESNVSLNNMYDDGTMGFKTVFTRSLPNTGAYIIKMNEMIEFEQITDFAINAERDGYYQVTEKGDSIGFDKVNIVRNGRNVQIFRDLYLKGDALFGDEFLADNSDDIDINEKMDVDPMKLDTLTREQLKEVGMKEDLTITDVVFPMFIDESKPQGCGTLFYADNLYYVPPIYDKNDFVQIKYIEMAYDTIFDYNEKNLNDNEEKFNKFLTVNILKKTKLVETNDTLKIHIISSASKVPTLAYTNNQSLSEARANEAEAKILGYLKSIGFDMGKVMISKDSKVQGPNYADDRRNVKKYREYQYVKIWVMVCEGRVPRKK